MTWGSQQPWGAGPFPSRTGCAGSAWLGVRVPYPGSPAVVGPSPCHGHGDWRKLTAAPDRVRPSVCPSAAARHWLFARHSLKLMVGTPGLACSGAGLEVQGVLRWGCHSQHPQPCHPKLPAVGKGLAEVQISAQPEPLTFGTEDPMARSCPSRRFGGSAPSGVSWGGWGAALLQSWGRQLPTCLPLRVVFPPEFQICLGFAVIWLGTCVGRAGTACRMRPRGRAGAGRAASRVPHSGLGELHFGEALEGLCRGCHISPQSKASSGCPHAAPATIL